MKVSVEKPFGRRNPALVSLCCALAILLSACGTPDDSDLPLADKVPTWTLVEDLRIGDAGDDDPRKSFNDVRGIVATSTGTIFVLDHKTGEVRVFDSSGTFLRLAARKGSGPGELEFGNGMAVGVHDSVWVSDPRNGRFSLYTPDGSFVRQLAISMTRRGDFWPGNVNAAGDIVDLPVRVATSELDPKTERIRTEDKIRLIRSDGTADTVGYPQCAPDPPSAWFRYASGSRASMSLPYSSNQQIAISRAGVAWCTPSSEYRLFASAIGGDLKEVVFRNVIPQPVTAEERREAIARLEEFARAQGLTADGIENFPTSKPVIDNIFADDRGRAWVRRSEMTDSILSFDVFEPSGRAVAAVKSRGDVGRVTFITSTHLYTVLPDENDVPFVVRYRIVQQ